MRRQANGFRHTTDRFEALSNVFKAMSCAIRLNILYVLWDNEVCVQDVVDQVGTTQSNISQHLTAMCAQGVLCTRKAAKRVYYRVADAWTLEAISAIHDALNGCSQQVSRTLLVSRQVENVG